VKRYRVVIVEDAEQDLIDIHDYVAVHDSGQAALDLLDELESLCLSLAEQPSRGHLPPELERVGVAGYLEVHFKPYRVIYEITGNTVCIQCVVDSRRDMQTYLERRLLR